MLRRVTSVLNPSAGVLFFFLLFDFFFFSFSFYSISLALYAKGKECIKEKQRPFSLRIGLQR